MIRSITTVNPNMKFTYEPSKFKETNAHHILSDEEVCGCNCSTPCGRKSIRFHQLQKFASPEIALLFICCLSFLQQLVMNGLTSTVISTVENRFQLQSTESGLVVSVYDICRGIGLLILLYPVKHRSKPLWLGISAVVISAGSFLFSMPHYMTPDYQYKTKEILNFCGNVTEPDCGKTNIRMYRFVFMMAMALMGIGSSVILVFGITYIDENVTKEKSAKYSSVYFAMGAWGPAVGFACGGASLKLFVDVLKDNEVLDIDSSSPQWIGAWWLVYLIAAGLLLAISPPLLLLPKRLKNSKIDENKQNSAQLRRKFNPLKSPNKTYATVQHMQSFIRNRTLILSSLNNALIAAFIIGFNTFGVKYSEAQFGLDSTISSWVYGGAAIVFFTASQLTSATILARKQLDVNGMMKYVTFCNLLSLIAAFGFFIHCSDEEFAGGTVPYPGTNLDIGNLTSECNAHCGCSTDRFYPITDENHVTYFSPCFGGCTGFVNESYTDCACAEANSSLTAVAFHIEDHHHHTCPTWKIAAFTIFAGLCIFTSGLNLTPLTQITLRCVPFSHRTSAVSFQQLLTVAFGTVPGRILTGKVIDVSCLVWSTKCGELGSCKLYKLWNMASNITYLLVIECVLILILSIIMMISYKRPSTESEISNLQNET